MIIPILPHVRTDQVLRMVRETGMKCAPVNGRPCLMPINNVIPINQKRRVK